MHRLASFIVSERMFALAAPPLAAPVGLALLGHRSVRGESNRVQAFKKDMFPNVTAASALRAQAEQMMNGKRVFRIAGAHSAPVLVTAPHVA